MAVSQMGERRVGSRVRAAPVDIELFQFFNIFLAARDDNPNGRALERQNRVSMAGNGRSPSECSL